IVAGGAASVYFVDDNFIGNQKATLELLPHLIEWQRAHRYPLRFACEATLNIAKNERVLALMREAGFVTIFCGIETPEPQALRFPHAVRERAGHVAAVHHHGLRAGRRLRALYLQRRTHIFQPAPVSDEPRARVVAERPHGARDPRPAVLAGGDPRGLSAHVLDVRPADAVGG